MYSETIPAPAAGPEPEPVTTSASERRPGDRGRREYDPTTGAYERWVTAIIVCGCSIFTLLQLHPGLLIADTTPAGGDMGAHVWGPAYLRDHLIPQGRLTGWTPDWYAGFPAYHFYMIVPSLMILLLDLVLPYGAAFKIITVSGVVMMPVAAWFFGRMGRLAFPGPALLAVASLPFLFDRGFTIYGGNIASTLAGEFAFSISLTIAIAYLGVLLRGLETGKHGVAAAVLLALVGLTHLIPAIFATGATLVIFFLHRGSGPIKWLAGVAATAAALGAFWVLPFLWRRPFLNDMGWEKEEQYIEKLLPGGQFQLSWLRFGLPLPADGFWFIIFVFALIGAAFSFVRRSRLGLALTVSALLVAGVFVMMPQGRLWNARLLPFYYLSLYLLAGVGVAELIRSFRGRMQRIVGAIVVAALGLIVIGLPAGALPFSERREGGGYTWLGFESETSNFVVDWAKWNYEGYERKSSYGEYYQLINSMDEVGASQGCGRVMWEYEKELDRFGTPMALMLLPHWTDGCLGSMEGLYFEASSSTPFHFLNQSELSLAPSRAQRDLPYRNLDLENGVDHLQLMGVRYYMAFSDQAVSAARAHPDLTEIRTIGDLRDVAFCEANGGTTSRRGADCDADAGEVVVQKPWQWTVFMVAGSELVEPLPNLPAVVEGMTHGAEDWLEPAVEFYQDTSRWDVLMAQDGPAEWPRVGKGALPTGQPVDGMPLVTDIESTDSSISFRVDQIGRPVLVKASYFPNWKVDGAEGPYRVMPNLMAVVPTSNDVRLHYGYTGIDLFSYLLTALGLGGLVWLARRPTIVMSDGQLPERPAVTGGPDDDGFGDDPVDADEAAVELEGEPEWYEDVASPIAPDPVTADPAVVEPEPVSAAAAAPVDVDDADTGRRSVALGGTATEVAPVESNGSSARGVADSAGDTNGAPKVGREPVPMERGVPDAVSPAPPGTEETWPPAPRSAASGVGDALDGAADDSERVLLTDEDLRRFDP